MLLPAIFRNKLLLVFCLLSFAAIASGIKLVVDVNGEIARITELPKADTSTSGKTVSLHAMELLQRWKTRLFVLLGIMTVCFGSMIYLFARKILVPLNALSRATKEISRGNLTVTVPSHCRDEMGELGEIINDLSSNFQEVLLLTGTAVGNSRSAVERIEKVLEPGKGSPSGEAVEEQVKAIKRDLELLGSIVQDFEFYQTHFDGRKVVRYGGGAKS